jgi:xanthine dehydrogenase accessory factor
VDVNDRTGGEFDRAGPEGPAVRIVVASVRGSAPREAGATMLVRRHTEEGSIGGGNLEFQAIAAARRMLAAPGPCAARVERFALGTRLGQCCGGSVELWFDRCEPAALHAIAQAGQPDAADTTLLASVSDGVSATRRVRIDAGPAPAADLGTPPLAAIVIAEARKLRDSSERARLVRLPDGTRLLLERVAPARMPLWLFGAGHVGRALVKVLADLPFDVTWVDSRPDAFPATLPANTAVRLAADPAGSVGDAPRSACFLVLTHSHDLDYGILRALLERNEFRWAGFIGSETKATCFALRFDRDGIPPERVARLTSPIGVGGIDSKLPAAIAVAVAAQLLQVASLAAAQAAAPATPAFMKPDA